MGAYDPPTRISPALPPEHMQTYRIRSPHDTTVKVACEQAGCEARRRGWDTTVDERTSLGQFQATYIRESSGRTFREMKTADGLTVFRFEPGQRCFADHQTLPERFLVARGDWRVHTRGTDWRAHVRAADWVEDCGLNLQAWHDATERG